ncbi:tetratricopeptide repeat [Brachionus plicatilis]|uniref:Tetratricopeptide repeat n=1 Tax=Brachionus plicatilis TaxID=10195 RepID=A0A3M7QRN9_BRAPC|nr:tetratricopeptide repeat [Brachionus plicatilis]
MNENISDIQQIKDKDWDMMEKNKKHLRKLIKNFQYSETTIDSNILDLFEKLGDYTSIAENSYEKSLTILEKIYEFSAIKTKTSEILQKIGLDYYNMGKYEKALEFNNKSLMMKEKIHSNRPDHPNFALTLHNIGLVYDKMRNFEKALEYYDKSLKIAEKVYLNRPDHPALPTLFSNIGSVYNNMEKYENAIEYNDKS